MNKLFGAKIKHKRKLLRLTLEEVAEAIGSSKSYVWDLENKESSNPSAKKAYDLSKFLELPLDYLIDDNYNIGTYPANDTHCGCKYHDMVVKIKHIIN